MTAGGTDRVLTATGPTSATSFLSGMDSRCHIKSSDSRRHLIAPARQSNDAVVKNLPTIFLMKPDGTSASETWEGRYPGSL